jgi:hypothetical protein
MGDDFDEGFAQDGPAACRGGALLVSALRRMALGQGCAALVQRDFTTAFPGDASEVFATFRAFLQALAHAGRRKLRIAYPGSPVPMPDEVLLLGLIAAGQNGNDALFEAYLRWLTLPEAREAAAITARALAAAFAAHGQWLRPQTPRHCEEPRGDEAISRHKKPEWREIASRSLSSGRAERGPVGSQ